MCIMYFLFFLQKVVIYYNIQYLSNLDPYLEVFSFEKMCISETKVGGMNVDGFWLDGIWWYGHPSGELMGMYDNLI